MSVGWLCWEVAGNNEEGDTGAGLDPVASDLHPKADDQSQMSATSCEPEKQGWECAQQTPLLHTF